MNAIWGLHLYGEHSLDSHAKDLKFIELEMLRNFEIQNMLSPGFEPTTFLIQVNTASIYPQDHGALANIHHLFICVYSWLETTVYWVYWYAKYNLYLNND